MKPLPAWIRLFRDEQGVGSVLMIILLPMFIGLAALAIDGASAYRMQTILQSTADAAAHAAAIDLPNTTTAAATAISYAQKNLPVAANGNVLVSGDITTGTWVVATRTFTAGGASPNAIRVTVRRATANGNALPTSFLGIIGRSSWDVSATATAASVPTSHPICLLTLGDFTANGGPLVNFDGCLVMADGTATCNGGAPVLGSGAETAAVGSVSNHCSPDGTRFAGVPAVTDPYASATDPNFGKYPTKNIPANPCTAPPKSGPTTALNYSWEPSKPKDPALSSFNQWSGPQTIGGAAATTIVCGDLKLTANVTVNTPSTGGLLVIENGMLDLNGFSLTAPNGSPLTIVFSGDSTDTHQHSPSGNGALSFNATPPAASGDTTSIAAKWHGVALYQDPRLTAGVDFTATGSNTTWNMSGLIYVPNSNLTYSGAVNKYGTATCFVTVAKTVTVNGQGHIYAQTPDGSGCQLAGLDQPNASLPGWQIVM